MILPSLLSAHQFKSDLAANYPLNLPGPRSQDRTVAPTARKYASSLIGGYLFYWVVNVATKVQLVDLPPKVRNVSAVALKRAQIILAKERDRVIVPCLAREELEGHAGFLRHCHSQFVQPWQVETAANTVVSLVDTNHLPRSPAVQAGLPQCAVLPERTLEVVAQRRNRYA
jgi:hypothetical protein